jgi:hypothetical protein
MSVSIPPFFKLQDASVGTATSGLVYSYAGGGNFQMLDMTQPGQTYYMDYANFYVMSPSLNKIPAVLPSAIGLYYNTDATVKYCNGAGSLNYKGLQPSLGWGIGTQLTNLLLVQAFPCDPLKCSNIFYVYDTVSNKYLNPASVYPENDQGMNFATTKWPWSLLQFGPSFKLKSTDPANALTPYASVLKASGTVSYSDENGAATFEMYNGYTVVSDTDAFIPNQGIPNNAAWGYVVSYIDQGNGTTAPVGVKSYNLAATAGVNSFATDLFLQLNTSIYLSKIVNGKFTLTTTQNTDWILVPSKPKFGYYIQSLTSSSSVNTVSPTIPPLINPGNAYNLTCNGSACIPTPSPGPIPSPTPNPTPTPGPQPSPQPRPSPTPNPTPTPGPQPSPQPRPSPTPNPTPSPRPSPSPTPSSSHKGLSTTVIALIATGSVVVVAIIIALIVVGTKKGWIKPKKGSIPLASKSAPKLLTSSPSALAK